MKSKNCCQNRLTSWIATAAISSILLAGARAEEPPKKISATSRDHKAGYGAHVHGNAKLTLALDTDSKGVLLFESPGDSVIGFEHAATSAGDKRTQAKALAILNEKGPDLFSFDPSAKCTLQKTRVEIKKEDHDEHEQHGEHNEVEAEYALSCSRSLSGTFLNVGLGNSFPKIKNLEVQVLKSKGQSSTQLKGALGQVKIKRMRWRMLRCQMK
jgi:hypothetical protein